MMLRSLICCNQVWVFTYCIWAKKKKRLNEMKMLLLFWWEKMGTWTVFVFLFFSAIPSFANGSLSGYVAGSQVMRQGSVMYGEDILALPPMVGENTVSPALLLCFLSSAYRRDFNRNEDERGEPSTLSLLSLQRYKTSFFLACCKNRAFFKKTKNKRKKMLILPKRLLRNYFEYI